jgi:S-(hydroxymethyl)glutathione dehydrogenase/alcohol dehydrogenase
MKAAILWELNKPLDIRDDVTLNEPGPGDVRIKLVSSGVCHSDVSAQNGTIPSGTPCVLGHEGAGIIQEVGSAVTDVKVGDHVILAFTPACRKCKPCLRGQSNLCETMISMATSPHFVVDGKTIPGFTGCGTFAEEMIVPENAAIPVDEDIPLDIVSLIGCGVTTGGARIAGAAVILAVDTVDSKLEMAKQFGATHTVTPDELEGAKNEITAGEGFDYALECVGHPQTIRQTYDLTRRGGTAVIVGVGRLDQQVQFSAFELFYAEKNLKGSMYGSANVRVDFPRLLRLWKYGKLDLEGMITRRMPVDDVNEAFRAMKDGEVIRSVLEF